MDKLTNEQRRLCVNAIQDAGSYGFEDFHEKIFSAGLAEGRREAMEVLRELVACADTSGPQIVFTTGYRWHDIIDAARALCERYPK